MFLVIEPAKVKNINARKFVQAEYFLRSGIFVNVKWSFYFGISIYGRTKNRKGRRERKEFFWRKI